MEKMDKFMLAYTWFITVFGALFLGGELATARHEREKELIRSVANERLQKCNEVITGNMK